MAYQLDNKTGDIVISGFEYGIADSPYEGLMSIKNFNIWYLKGAVYSNYKRNLVSTTAGNASFTAANGANVIVTSLSPFNIGDAFTVSGGSLPPDLATGTTYYKVNSSNGISATKGGTAITFSGGAGSGTLTLITMGKPKYWTQNSATLVYYIQDINGRVWEGPDANNYWTLLGGNEAALTGGGHGIVFYNKYLLVFRQTASGTIDYWGDGSKVDQTVFHASWKTGYTSGTQTTGGDNQAIWGDDNVAYFCNNNWVGSIRTTAGSTFDPTSAGTYTYNPLSLQLPNFEVATWLSELRVNLMIAAGKKIYPWDRTSTNFDIPIFCKEVICKVINILNNLYILAGIKGNIYVSNGYSVSLFKHIPDSFWTNTSSNPNIDPAVLWGDIMNHRNRIYVGATQADVTNGISGIFSIDQATGVISMENQNSFGSTLSTGAAGSISIPSGWGASILIDIDSAESDTYYSAWWNGTQGGVDNNITSISNVNPNLYSSNELEIISDIIPVGTFLNQRSFLNVEFKLDRPLATGDSITVYARQYITDSWTSIGTTTSTSLAVPFSNVLTPMPIQNFQWLQLKITASCNSSISTSSFIRLREIRIR